MSTLFQPNTDRSSIAGTIMIVRTTFICKMHLVTFFVTTYSVEHQTPSCLLAGFLTATNIRTSLTGCPCPFLHVTPIAFFCWKPNSHVEIAGRMESHGTRPSNQSCRPVDSPVSAKNIQETLRKSAEYQAAHPANGTSQ